MKVIVVGGGVIGLGIAWRCSRAGLDVAVFDPEPKRAAANVAAGMLCPVSEADFGEEDVLQLSLASARAYPEFAAELSAAAGQDAGYIHCGSVAPARDGDDMAAIDRMVDFQRELGLDVERLTSKEIRRLEPALAGTIRGGARIDGDHQIDNRRLLAALATACDRAGVELHRDQITFASRSEVRTPDESHNADAVVVAGGAWSSGIELVGGTIPVRPIKGQILRLRSSERIVSPERVIRGVDVYVVPRPWGEVVVGASVEDLGFDTTITAGVVHDLLRDAWEVVPGVAEMELIETAAGVRPGSPDNGPMIGSVSDDGPIIASGHHRNGILLMPVTANAIADLVTEGALPAVASSFSPARFTCV